MGPVSSVHFVVGRLRKHLLRADTLDGWLGDDASEQQQAGAWKFERHSGGRLGVAAPGAQNLSLSAEGAAALAAAGEGAIVLVGWPEEVLVVRRGGAVVYGEGDILHFGDLALDPLRTLRRTGFDYLSEQAADVRVHLELEERSGIVPEKALRRGGFAEPAAGDGPDASPAPPVSDSVRLEPGEKARFGPYELSNERSYDFERRPIAGQSGHAYFFRLRRATEDPVASRPPGIPDPFEARSGAELVACARALGLLADDEVWTGEAALATWLGLYEGPRGALEKELRGAGPSAPQLYWRGDTLEAHAARLARAEAGAPVVGRGVVQLAPVGPPRVQRWPGVTLPGRLRRPGSKTGTGPLPV
jgi:hypothetical protein